VQWLTAAERLQSHRRLLIMDAEELYVKAALQGQVASMEEWFNRSTRVLDEADSGFAPKEGVFTTAQQVAHVAQTFDWFVQGAFAEGGFDSNFEAMDQQVRGVTSLGAAREWLAKAVQGAQACIEAHSEQEWQTPLPAGPIMGGMPRMVIFGAIMDHTAHHRGALTVYSRLLGKVPAMPYMDM
jgi:uncharacterized damage-inducible protein DinB